MPNKLHACHEPDFFGIFLSCQPIKLTASDQEPVALGWRAYLVINAELNRQRENQAILNPSLTLAIAFKIGIEGFIGNRPKSGLCLA
jgi:hypothetical protein